MRSVQVISAILCVFSLVTSLMLCAYCSDDALIYAKSLKTSQSVSALKTAAEPTAGIKDSTKTLADGIADSADLNSSEKTADKSDVSSKSDTAKGKEKKLGKVYGQFFSPYTANTAYNNTFVNNQSGVSINIKQLLSSYKSTVAVGDAKPQVLIMHTHATENYTKNDGYYTKSDLERTGKADNSVIGVGNKLEAVLKKGGISVLHDKTLHDSPSYNGSYSRSAVTVSKYLKKYPSISVVIDLHRDAIGDGDDLVKPVTEIKGKKAAQVMICVGSNTGTVDYFPNWKENLKLGVKLQQTMEVLYPGLARALFLARDRCYNQNLSKGSVIIEFGTNGNTFDEAEYSAQLVGNAMVTMFKNKS